MKVIDAFPFRDEFDVLRCRLKLLHGVVDKHVVAEGSHTHQGAVKPLYLDRLVPKPANLERIICDLSKMGAGDEANWVREGVQRDYLALYLRSLLDDGYDPDALVISSDADELVDPECLKELYEHTDEGPVIIGMRMIYYGRWEAEAGWYHAKAFRLRDLPESLSALRLRFDLPVMTNAGWHTSYLGAEAQLRRKVEAFAHQENLSPEVWDRIRRGGELGLGPNGEQLIPLDRTGFPEQILRLLG